MGLTQEEKDTLIQLEIEKSERFMAQADQALELGMFDMALNRYYYSCFHVVMALFIKEDITSHRHKGQIIQFSLHFVKTGRVSKEIGSILSRLEQMREAADYNCHYDVTDEEAKSVKPRAKKFQSAILELITFERAVRNK